MNRELGANDAIRFPCVRNARIMSHQSGPFGAPTGGFGLVFAATDGATAGPPAEAGAGSPAAS